MPDLLILSPDHESLIKLEQLSTKKGFRYKSTIDPKTASEWLRLREFDAIFVAHSFEMSTCQELAHLLWKRKPLATAALFDLAAPHPELGEEAKLMGTEVACGPKALDRLSALLDEAEKRAKANAMVDLNILVVEDLDSPRDIICFYLESLGAGKVTGVRSAKEALSQLEKDPQRETCVITDIRMPDMDGRELIMALRQHQKLQRLPIIALTAYGTVDTLVDCLKAGASGFLVKPPKREDLIRELSRAMRILASRANPRLANEHEAEALRDVLLDRGFS